MLAVTRRWMERQARYEAIGLGDTKKPRDERPRPKNKPQGRRKSYIPTKAAMPQDGQWALTKTSVNGLLGERVYQLMKRVGDAWMLPDGAEYAGRAPNHWRPVSDAEIARMTRAFNEAR